MIDPLGPMLGSPLFPAGQNLAAEKVKTEFLSVFYKEMLKQAFKVPNLSPNGEEKENNYVTSITNDMLIEQLAQEMLKNQALRSSLIGGGK